MNVDIWSFSFGLVTGIALVLISGVVVKIGKKEGQTAKEKFICPRCGSKRINAMKDKPGVYWCGKCGYEHNTIPDEPTIPAEAPLPPQPKPQMIKCPICGKEFAGEKKMRKHYGMAHYDQMKI